MPRLAHEEAAGCALFTQGVFFTFRVFAPVLGRGVQAHPQHQRWEHMETFTGTDAWLC